MKIGHFELVTASATAAAVAGTAGAALAGDSLTIKNGKNPRILSAWADLQSAGMVQIIRPSGHDTTRDLRFRVPASENELLIPLGRAPRVEPQETLGITFFGAAVAGDVEQACMLIGYEDLPGSNQRNITWPQLQSRGEQDLTIECTITAAAGPAYSGAELITAESDLLKANTDYAILGARIGIECGALCIAGPDTGNVRIGIPGNDLDGELTGAFFALLARAHDAALIPVINSGNRAATFISVSQDENATAVTASLYLVQLR